MNELPRILAVDDEEKIRSAMARSLRKRFALTTAGGGAEALEIMARVDEPFQVIVSDMRMPEMDGAVFLKKARDLHPDTVRILLTGYADLEAVVAAVNKGHIYRFLSKPCPVETLAVALTDAVRQHELITAERILLEKTLKGSLKAMTEILAVASPAAVGHADRVRRLALDIAEHAGLEADWQFEVAAMLSELGCVTLPPETVSRYFRGEELTPREADMAERIPMVSHDILEHIPRLETALAMIPQVEPLDPEREEQMDRKVAESCRRARAILRLASDAVRLRAAGWPSSKIADYLETGNRVTDRDLLRIYREIAPEDDEVPAVRGMAIRDLRVGMRLAEDVRSDTGLLLIGAGQDITLGMLEKITNFHSTKGLEEPVWVVNPEIEEADGADQSPVGAVSV